MIDSNLELELGILWANSRNYFHPKILHSEEAKKMFEHELGNFMLQEVL